MSESVKKYLIRSSGCILGPYNKEEIEGLIEDGTLSINDEVIDPCSIAFYLQDHFEFTDFIQSLSMENRLTNFVMNFSGKISTVTRKTVKMDSEDTQTITKPIDQEENLTQVEDADFELIEKKPQQESDSSQYKTAKESDQIIRKKVRSTIKRFWQLIVVFSVAIFGFIFFNEFIHPYQKKKNLLEKIKVEGVNFYNAGNYEQSFKIFKEGSEKNILDVEEKKVLLNILIQQRKTEQAGILLGEIESSLSQSHIALVKGLIAFFENSYSSAESFFSQVQGDDKDLGLLNLILLKWVQKDYQGVLNRTNDMILRGYERGIIFYLKNFSLIKLGIEKKQIKNYIKNNLKSSPEYYQELMLLLAYLYVEEGNLKEIERLVTNILDWDYDFYREYSYNSLVPVDILNWSFLFPYCDRLFKIDMDNYLLTALYGFCNLKIGSDKKGFQYIEKSKNQNPKNDLIISMYVYSLIQNEFFVKAETFLNRIKKSSYKLPYILKARFFEHKKEWNLALTYWETLLKIDPYHLSAIGGMAFCNYKIKNYDNIKIYKDRGLDLYPYYVKLLSLP